MTKRVTTLCVLFMSITKSYIADDVPLPNKQQLEFMDMETIQFMHFSIPTFWQPSDAFLRGPNPTVGGNCQLKVTGTSNDSQTRGYWPCLNPEIFNPAELDVDQWMEASAALGMKEICLTAKHFGGFTLWPSAHTPYGVQTAKNWRGGRGDVLREFADAANRWGIKICYYCNPRDDGYLARFGNLTPLEFERRQLGMLSELMDSYGPVNRFWFDGGPANPPDNPEARPIGTNCSEIYAHALALIRERSPDTLVSPYRGDVCATTKTLYTRSSPRPNSTDPSGCAAPDEAGMFFQPSEMHGITMQEGPDGNTDSRPTYWFWHPWACAGNKTGCPWVGHANASRVFEGYLATVGHGGVMNMNIPPDASGRLNRSVVEVMREAGTAINDTFYRHSAGFVQGVSGACAPGIAVVEVQGPFDYVVSMEDLSRGQRIGNYSVDFQRRGSSAWEVLVPPHHGTGKFSDRPDGHDPLDSHIGHKRIDTPVVATSGPDAVDIARVRFNCIRLVERHGDISPTVFLRNFSLHKKRVPWEESPSPRGHAGEGKSGDGGQCYGVTSTGFDVSYPTTPHSKQAFASAAYVGVFRTPLTPVTLPSALIMAEHHNNTWVASLSGVLRPDTTYTMRWRFRQGDESPPVNFGFGWGEWVQPAFQCTTLPRGEELRSPPGVQKGNKSPPGVSEENKPPPGISQGSVRTLRVYRSSEFTLEDVDFLMNHSSGDARGESVLLSRLFSNDRRLNSTCLAALGTACPGLHLRGRECLECVKAKLPIAECGKLRPPVVDDAQGNSEAYFFCGSGFPSFYRASPLAEYTVDYLPYTHPGGERLHAAFEPGFVPYSSCDAPNYGFANTPLHPLCNCQVTADRHISRMNDVNTVCPPNGPREPDGGREPQCNCSLAYALANVTQRDTLRHIGQAPVYFPLFPSSHPPWSPSPDSRFGSFFSTGAPGHCAGVLGTGGCTWKMRSVVRVLGEHDLERSGFYKSQPKSVAGAEASAKAFMDAWDGLDEFILASPMGD